MAGERAVADSQKEEGEVSMHDQVGWKGLLGRGVPSGGVPSGGEARRPRGRRAKEAGAKLVTVEAARSRRIRQSMIGSMIDWDESVVCRDGGRGREGEWVRRRGGEVGRRPGERRLMRLDLRGG
jgi:hypothetical protein